MAEISQREKLKAIAGRLEAEANDRVAKRSHIEKRWIDDLQQYHGQYDSQTAARLRDGNKSKLFPNLTRPKTNAMTARLTDLLFPTDDRNWGIQPTPVPSLTAAAEAAADIARELQLQLKEEAEAAAQAESGRDPAQMARMDEMQRQAREAQFAAATLQGRMDEARRRSELMEQEIDDQLKESEYHAAMRDMVEDACKLGTGVCKGPIVGDRIRKGWQKNEAGAYSLAMSEGKQPSMRHVDVWSFFPDMDAAKIGDSEGVYERHLMNSKKLRALAQLPGFYKDAIRQLLEVKPQTAAPAYIADLRSITASNNQVGGDCYHVWEYSGPLKADDMLTLAQAMGDSDTAMDLEDIDPLAELQAVVWFCQGEVLKFSIYPFDSGECIYSVFNLEKDEASIFGYGIPWIMRDAQSSMNASWRAMLDNAGLSTGPQIVVDTKQIEPADNNWEISPRKIWKARDGIPRDRSAFEVFNIPSNQPDLANIFMLSKQLADDTTQMPMIAQGEQGSSVTKTAHGMALLMNSANVVFRRIVKNFDDDVTTPNIRRFYDWNMQFNPKEEIKGDFNIDARGSSVLLVREMQAQNLMVLAMQLGGHPIYGPMLKNRDMLRMLFKAHMIPADEILLTEEEIEAAMLRAQAEAANDEPQDPRVQIEMMRMQHEQQKLTMDLQDRNEQRQFEYAVAMMKRETQVLELAEKSNLKIEEIRALLQDKREERDWQKAKFASEAAVTGAIGPSGGGYF